MISGVAEVDLVCLLLEAEFGDNPLIIKTQERSLQYFLKSVFIQSNLNPLYGYYCHHLENNLLI